MVIGIEKFKDAFTDYTVYLLNRVLMTYEN